MKRVVQRSTKTQQQSADLAYWLQRPMHERIAAVEMLRQDWESSTASTHAEPRLQRVCRVARLKDLADLESLGVPALRRPRNGEGEDGAA